MKKSDFLLGAAAIAVLISIPQLSLAQDRSAFSRDRNASVVSKPRPEFDQAGYRTSGFTYYPNLTLGVETNDNIYYNDANKESDLISDIGASLRAGSTWSRHYLGFAAKVDHFGYKDFTNESYTPYAFKGEGRIDVVGFSNLFGSAEIISNAEPRDAELTNQSPSELVKYNNYKATFGYVHEVNRLRGTIAYKYDAYNFDDVTAMGGGTIDEDYRDRKTGTVILKGEYAVSPAFSVFATFEPNTVKYDSSSVRDSKGYDITVGTSFDVSDLARGEIRIGSYNQNYDNSALKDASGVSFDGNLEWFPSAMTTVKLYGSNTLRESPVFISSGYNYSNYGVKIDHELFYNLLVSLEANASTSDFNDIDRTDDRTSVSLGGKYFFNRNLAATAVYRNSQLSSSGADKVREYKDNSFKVALTYSF